MVDLSYVLWGNTLQAYLVFIGILAAGALAGKLFSWIISNIIRKFAESTETKLDDVLVDVMDGPFVFAIFVITFIFAEAVLVMSPGVSSGYDAVVKLLITICIAWIIIRFLDSVVMHYVLPYTEKSESDLDDMLLPILRGAIKVVVISIAGVMILSDFGYNVTSIIAGLGIGGLAFALAAKDLIGNVFGGISVIADKPFKIKDMIKFDNRQGTIREIGLRTTRIETLDGTTLVIPNAKFTDGIVENITNRKQMRVSLVLGLEYSTTSKKLDEAKKILKDIIKKQHGVKNEECTVFFSAFNQSSCDLTFIYFITDLKSIPKTQDEVNMEIKARFEKAKINFAYPTQTMIMKK